MNGPADTAAAVPRFDRLPDSAPPPRAPINRIGDGALGGKAASLVRAHREILADLPVAAGLDVSVPAATVLTTDVFDAYMRHNDLWAVVREPPSDDALALAFQRAELPASVVGDVRALAARWRSPLAVRSSSRLEDALAHPFAGVYATKMLPQHEASVQARFRRLVAAIKFVYASTFFAEARAYAASVGEDVEREQMAVVVQEVVGRRHGERFYPTISGVARSYDHYAFGRNRPEDGVVHLALGLGKTIVDGGLSWSYNPRRPGRPPPFGGLRERMHNTQTQFWSVRMTPPPVFDPIREDEFLVAGGLADADYDGELRYTASTVEGRSGRLVPGVGVDGPRVLDFAMLLQFDDVPLHGQVRALLKRCEEVFGAAVEIEFAAVLDPQRGVPARLGLLQVRPMAVSHDEVVLDDAAMAGDGVLLASDAALGNGARDDLRDVIYLRPDAFDPAQTRAMADEIERLDAPLAAAGRPYLLIGFGRWGSSDPWLGVPVRWSQIAGARAIVEATLPGMAPDPSQGSHFFQNLIAFAVLYMTVRHDGPRHIDWEWLDRQPAAAEGRFARHVRLDRPLSARADGRSGRGVIRHGD